MILHMYIYNLLSLSLTHIDSSEIQMFLGRFFPTGLHQRGAEPQVAGRGEPRGEPAESNAWDFTSESEWKHLKKSLLDVFNICFSGF